MEMGNTTQKSKAGRSLEHKGSLIGKPHRPRTGSDDVNYLKNKTGVAHTFSLSRGRWISEF